jgi:6-phosphogluconolactonase
MTRNLVAAVLVTCAAVTALGAVPAAPKSSGEYFVYVGTYTAATSRGIYAWKFNPAAGALTSVGQVAETPNPAQVWVSPNGKFLYAVNWQGNDTVKGDTVSAYAINARTGALTFLNKVSSAGVQPNQVVVDPTGKIAVTVNYNTGTMAALPIEADGKLGEAFYVDQHSGQPLSPRQPGPRAHGVVFSKDARFAYVAELGLDRVYSYHIDPAKRTMTPLDPPYVSLKAGSGPRRLQLHPNGRFLYVNHETDSMVSVFEVSSGHLTEIQSVSTLPTDHQGNNTTAEIQIDAEGRFLYVSNRGHDSVAVYSVDPAKGTLTMLQNVPSLGRTPRNITIDPTNNYLFCANQGGDNVVVFKIDHKTGHLTSTGTQVQVSQPGGMAFVKAE